MPTNKPIPQVVADIVKAYFRKLAIMTSNPTALENITSTDLVMAFVFPAHEFQGFNYALNARAFRQAVVIPLNKLLLHADFTRLTTLELSTVISSLIRMQWPLAPNILFRLDAALMATEHMTGIMNIPNYLDAANLCMHAMKRHGNAYTIENRIAVMQACADTFGNAKLLVKTLEEQNALQLHKQQMQVLIQELIEETIMHQNVSFIHTELMCIASAFGIGSIGAGNSHKMPEYSPLTIDNSPTPLRTPTPPSPAFLPLMSMQHTSCNLEATVQTEGNDAKRVKLTHREALKVN